MFPYKTQRDLFCYCRRVTSDKKLEPGAKLAEGFSFTNVVAKQFHLTRLFWSFRLHLTVIFSRLSEFSVQGLLILTKVVFMAEQICWIAFAICWGFYFSGHCILLCFINFPG